GSRRPGGDGMTIHSPDSSVPAPGAAQDDVQFLRTLLARAQRRVDPHTFHAVHWGAIVLVWYPLVNWFESRGNEVAMAIVAGASLLLGTALSTLLEWRLKGR